MRIKMALLSCTAVAMAALLAPTAAVTDDDVSTCINPATPIVQVVEGPCPISDPGLPVCSGEGTHTAIQYKVMLSGLTDIATLVTANNTVSGGASVQPPCKGDSKTGLGKNSCHEKAVKPTVLTVGTEKRFWVVVEGLKEPIDTTVAGKKSGKVQCSKVAGLGLDSPSAPVTESLKHGDCSVEFTLNSLTGTVISARLTQESIDLGCSSPSLGLDGLINPADVADLQINLGGLNLGNANFGDGYLNSGENSCTTRVVGGRVYTFGRPCP